MFPGNILLILLSNREMAQEQELIDRTIRGDHQAFAQLVKLHERLIFHVLYGLVKNDQEEIDDLFQEVLIKVYHRLPSFRGKSKLSTWIGKIAYHHGLNHLRRERRKPETQSLEDLDETHMKEELSGFNSSDATTYLLKAIEMLPDQYRLILTLFHLDNLDYQEIGEVLRIAEGTVKSRLFRARKLLKEVLREIEDYEG